MRENVQGFMRIYHWVIEELEGDYKAIGLYAHLLKRMWGKKEPFSYVVNDRTYQVLAGQHMTGLRRIKRDLKIDFNVLKKTIAKLEKINAIQCETKIFVHPNGKSTVDGVVFTSLTPFALPNTLVRNYELPTFGNTNAPSSENRTLSNNIFISNNYSLDNSDACAQAGALDNEQRIPGETNMFDDDTSQDRKNIPPEPLDDPNDIRFTLDQRFDPRVRESVWRQLAVDWYYWASDNGKWRALPFTKYVDCVRAMIDSGQANELTLREMFDRVIQTNVFWQRNFKRIDRWNDYFSTGETRLTACLRDLKEQNEKERQPKLDRDGFEMVHIPF